MLGGGGGGGGWKEVVFRVFDIQLEKGWSKYTSLRDSGIYACGEAGGYFFFRYYL